MSNLINVVVSDKETPIPVPDTGGDESAVVPDTGRYTSTNDNNATGGGVAIFATILSSLLILSILLITFNKIFHKKASLNANLDSSNKNDKLNNNTNNSINKTNKLKTLGILLFIFTATTGIVAGILNHNNSPSYAAEGEIDITASDTTITVVREDGPAHAVASTTITLNEATPAGYNLYVYGPEGNELTAENTTATIKPVPTSNSAISNNTYGVTANTEDNAEEDQTAPVITDTVWNPVGSSEESPLLITTTTEATNAGDKVTIYYGILVDETIPAGIYTGNIEYKATTRTYAITYNANGGTINNESTITEHIAKGTTLGTLPTPDNRTGYTFNGWYTSAEPQQGETPITADTIPTNNTTYYAKWTRDTYTITYNLNGGNINGSTDNLTSNVPTGEALGTLPSTNPTKQNYTFNGWYTAAEGGTKITTETIPESATTYYAQYTRNQYTITYDLNGGNIEGNTEDIETTVNAGDTLGDTLPANPTRDGYDFVGWFTGISDGTEVNSETTPTGTVTYYAHWEEQAQALTLQNIPAVIEAVNNSPDGTAIIPDARDGKMYTVGKLADDRIWLLDNLDLDLTMENAAENITAENTNATTKSLNALLSGNGSGRYARNAVSTDWSDDQYTNPYVLTDYSGDTMSQAYEEINGEEYPETEMDKDWKVGTYYNYCAASAGSYCYEYSPEDMDAAEDICPAGWRMPTGNYDGEHDVLYNAYYDENDSEAQYNNFRNALRLPLAGHVYGGSVDDFGNYGRWWSATRNDDDEMYYLYVDTNEVSTGYYDYRNNGQSVRCVIDDKYSIIYDLNGGNIDGETNVIARVTPGDALGDTIPANPKRIGYSFLGWFTDITGGTEIDSETVPSGKVTYCAHWEKLPVLSILDIAAIDAAVQNEGDAILAVDPRNDKEYAVGRLADGKIWLLDNLDLDLTDSSVQSAMNSTNTNASNESLYALFNGVVDGGENENLARNKVTTDYSDSYTDPQIYTEESGNFESGYPVGTYYNFCAASAGSYCYDETGDDLMGNATEDICPAGWRMPTGDDGEYGALYEAYSYDYDDFRNNFRLPLSGYASSGSVNDFGYVGYWWSSTRLNNYDMYSLYTDTDSVGTNSYGDRNYGGYSVRCVMGS